MTIAVCVKITQSKSHCLSTFYCRHEPSMFLTAFEYFEQSAGSSFHDFFCGAVKLNFDVASSVYRYLSPSYTVSKVLAIVSVWDNTVWKSCEKLFQHSLSVFYHTLFVSSLIMIKFLALTDFVVYKGNE